MTSSLRRATRRVAVLAAAALLVCGLVWPALAAVTRPMRIVSLNACADQYLIALADKDQVAALTQFSRDPSLSYYAAAAKAYPVTQGQVEAVLALKPDLVITNPYQRMSQLSLLKGRVRFLDMTTETSFDDVVAETRRIAAAIGQPARGEALVRSMQARVVAAGRRPVLGVAAHYQRGGYLTGPGALIDDLMSRAGLVNLARRLHGGQLARLSLEEIVYQRPDYLVLSDGDAPGQDEGDLMLDHPALLRAAPPFRRLYVPSALTVCGGPSYPDALERLQAEADRARRRGAPTAGR